MSDPRFDRALDAVLASPSPIRIDVTGPGEPDEAALRGAFEELLGAARRRLGDPAFDDRVDGAIVRTWAPEAIRLAAWPRDDGLLQVALEPPRRRASLGLFVEYASDAELELRRSGRGRAGLAAAGRRASPSLGPFGWPGIDRYLSRPEGLQPLDARPRERLLRWLAFALLVALILTAFAILFVARRLAG